MLRDILTSKWILGSIGFMIIFATSCYFWYQLEVSPYKKEAVITTELIPQIKTPKVDTNDLTKDKTKTPDYGISADNGKASDAGIEKVIQEVSAGIGISETDIEKLFKDVAAEEEEIKETLTDKKKKARELKQKQTQIFDQIKALIASSGGTLNHTTTGRKKNNEILELYKEVVNLQQEIDGKPYDDINIFFNLADMVNNSLNQNGEMPVSAYLKLADYLEKLVKLIPQLRCVSWHNAPLTVETRLLNQITLLKKILNKYMMVRNVFKYYS